MKRRQLMRYAGAGLLTTMGTVIASEFSPSLAQKPSGGLSVQWLGHTCFLFTGSGLRILVNPFRPIGCTKGYRPPKVAADLVLISSQLLDEGEIEGLPGDPQILYEPGAYKVSGIQLQGISIAHDREGGRRFGSNVAWLWSQSGIKILHLGGAAAPLEIEQRILIGRPDLVLIPVGGGPKAYNPEEAKQAISALNPKMVIPTHYRTQAADSSNCEIVAVDEFLTLMDGMTVRRTNSNAIALKSSDLPENRSVIQLLSYNF
ncbi:MBL fold metallo-hydrolase [Allocoleopsis franciscana]|uniref:Putative Zn-dependent hydrolase of beta-lactamase fold protein n=1 Tax=Allocoleopsis franciscana PCC 7113 TaxID=1173027 RepID=K9W8X5_9CYAN|nr:MBL fold metallo-hydrolase [Allocoleopsis franciscana]AFZ16668.1 putative Zn-dependent hydrolase of beta-lactamase fold protein [Allocoleopsis franciscana PCC 7113]